ncbi:alpha/beta fold hydrolase [Actinoplanes sp. RD1]|uniref:alpha/beta fold hydrolase n=1 Tax=Actinoplanes sp. RD1 TaxID=3064538 RepID=UPI0027417DC4|nr:alpha/beta hydrolase [Actinoplanes sp. RD1]
MERFVEVQPGVALWTEESGDPAAPALLLVMGANAPGLTWPDDLVARLAARHRVIRYDHRDTGRSAWAYEEHPYAIADLAGDAVAVLDAYGIDSAHVVGMSMGGVLVQLLLLDHPTRVRTATMLNTTALGSGLAGPGQDDLPPVDPRLLALWAELDGERDEAAELDWRVRHWRLLNGDALPFPEEEFRRWEERAIAHAGRHDNAAAHALASQEGLERGAELAGVAIPALVIDAPQDPVNPPPHAERLAAAIPGARLVTIPGMGHALNPVIVPSLAGAILDFTTAR